MAAMNPGDIRNVVLTGQTGTGKTTLTERLLHDTGVIGRMGSVEDGSTTSDWTEEEKHHKHSLSPSILHFDHEGHTVNLIDTPGLADFVGQAIACFPAVETVAVVIDPARGIGTVTRRMMEIARQRNLPRMIIVNKIDEANIDIGSLTEEIREVFGSVCLPINLPLADCSGVVNVFDGDGAGGDTLFDSVDDAHTKIIEQVVEVDDELMSTYLEQGENLEPEQVHNAFEAALREGHLVPICYCSARDGIGIEALLHVFASLLPSPLEGNPRPFQRFDEEGNAEDFAPDAASGDGHLISHVFKVRSDAFVGKLGVFRVHQGKIKAKTDLFIDDHKKAVRVAHLYKRQGKDQVEVDEIGPGDLGAVAKIDDVHAGAVLHDHAGDGGIRLRPLPLPKPMYGLAIELASHKDESKFAPAIQKLMDEDPSLIVERIAATKQTVMRGLGELHLRVVLEKLKDGYGIEVVTSPPKVAYKETITAAAEGHHRHKKQSGGSGEFGEVHLRIAPLDSEHDEGFEFENATVGGSIPRQFMPAIEKGIRQVLSEGAIAGYPLTGVRVEVFDGKHHAVDSKEVAFIKAGRMAFIDAVQKARPALLEPFVDLEIVVPSTNMGDITGVLSGKRGQVQNTDIAGDTCIISATAPLGELQNFTNELKSITGGAGSFTMDYSHDERTPPHIQQEVVAAYKPHDHE